MWTEFRSPAFVLLKYDSFCLIVDDVPQFINIHL